MNLCNATQTDKKKDDGVEHCSTSIGWNQEPREEQAVVMEVLNLRKLVVLVLVVVHSKAAKRDKLEDLIVDLSQKGV